jgi:oligopeptide/dipeptide ABC transporter ATP-binding protein
MGSGDATPVLSVRDLVTEFRTEAGVVAAVNGVSYDLFPGETLGIVGESGSGKSVTVMSMLGLVPNPPGRVTAGEVLFDGVDLLKVPRKRLREIRGREIAMVFQDPMTSLNPVHTVGAQIVEALRSHDRKLSRKACRARAVELLDLVGVPNATERVRQYPHEFSGGMRQRAMIAIAIANHPKVLIADEPTTALDVTIQAQVLEVLQAAQRETGAATVLITHDLGLVAEMADRVMVMYAGKVVESADVFTVFREPRHPYTVGLMTSLPRLDVDLDRLVPISGQPPNLISLPQGCAFAPRCRIRRDREECLQLTPPLIEVGDHHLSACHFHGELAETETIQRELDTGALER